MLTLLDSVGSHLASDASTKSFESTESGSSLRIRTLELASIPGASHGDECSNQY